MREKILNDLKTAMKSQDRDTLKVIGMVKGSIWLEEINLKRKLSDNEINSIKVKRMQDIGKIDFGMLSFKVKKYYQTYILHSFYI